MYKNISDETLKEIRKEAQKELLLELFGLKNGWGDMSDVAEFINTRLWALDGKKPGGEKL